MSEWIARQIPDRVYLSADRQWAKSRTPICTEEYVRQQSSEGVEPLWVQSCCHGTHHPTCDRSEGVVVERRLLLEIYGNMKRSLGRDGCAPDYWSEDDHEAFRKLTAYFGIDGEGE